MASNTRAELRSELAKLRKRHYEALAQSTFGGFTPDEEARHLEQAKQIAALVQQLEALDAPPES